MASGAPHQEPQPQAPATPNEPNGYFERHVQGYPRLAYYFAQTPRLLHLRQFASLSIRSLLYRQHRLAELEDKLLDVECENAESSETDQRMCVRDFRYMRDEPGANKEMIKAQRTLYEEIQRELKEYGRTRCV